MSAQEWNYVSQYDVKHHHPQFETTFASALSVPSRLNRYSDVLANEATLFPTPSSPMGPINRFNDIHNSHPAVAFPYINANLFVPNRFNNCPHSIVACQSPQPEQLYAFWQTILVYQVPLIVMLTRLYEVKKDRIYMKAEPYWPEPGQPIIADDSGITVEVISDRNDEANQTIYRSIRITKGNISHVVEHLHFCGWADYSVPDNTNAFMNIVNKMEHAPSNQGPIFVHCSAGIGRTGTLMGVYYGRHLQKVAGNTFASMQEARAAMIELVCRMKRTRSGMVQKQEQLQYMLSCLGF